MNVQSFATLIDPIRARAAAAPDFPNIVLLYEGGRRETVTVGELWQDVLVVAGGLRRAGLHADEVALVIVEHSRHLLTAFLGAMALGVVPTMVATPTPRMDAEAYRQRIETLARTAAAAAVIASPPLAAMLQGLTCKVVSTDVLTGAPDAGALNVARTREDAAFIQFTSGSGGAQKGAVHTHGGVLRYIAAKYTDDRFGADDVVVNWAPLYHDLGLLSGLLAPVVLGFRSVLIAALHWVRQPGILLQAMHEFRGRAAYMPNFALNHCVRAVREADCRGLDLSSWTLLTLGGEPVRVASLRAFADRFRAQGFRESAFLAGYGQAEMVEGVTRCRGGPPNVDWISIAALQRDARAVPVGETAAGACAFVSCGPPKDGAELRIVGPDAEVLPERAVGEIEVRCEYRMREYHLRPDLTAAAFRDGWFRTGDLGYLVGRELYVVGRKSDMIIVGGRNLAPEEIEAVAEQVDGALGGRTVAFGVSDERAGTERVVLVCESAQPDDPELQIDLERRLRAATTQALDLTLGEVRLVPRGWIVKTSSGKKARGDSRAKYLCRYAGSGPEAP